jgi:bacterioferritin-associated ferredoxin
MFVCICNGITQRQIVAAIEAGAQTVTEVYEYYHAIPKCCSCEPEIAQLLATRQQTPRLRSVDSFHAP